MIGIGVAADISTEIVGVFSEPVDDSTEIVDVFSEPVDVSTDTVDISAETDDVSTETVDVSTETVDVVSGTATHYSFSCECSYECDAGSVGLDYLTGGVVTESNEAVNITLSFTTGP